MLGGRERCCCEELDLETSRANCERCGWESGPSLDGLPMPAAAAESESVRVTPAMRDFAVDGASEAVGANKGSFSETVFVCSAWPESDDSLMCSYSEPSWPTEGNLTLGGRGGRSLETLLLRLEVLVALPLGGKKAGSFSGERAYEALPGETERSMARRGRGGMAGTSTGFELAGRGGIIGMTIVKDF
jgi:hypothetical protein